MMILPSILSQNFAMIPQILHQLEQSQIKAIHFDVMDNHFVPYLTFGAKLIADLRSMTSLLFDVHLMIENPYTNLSLFIEAQPNIITAHIEAFHSDEEIEKSIQLCHQNNIQFGLAVKPKTPIETIFKPYLKDLDLVLVMTVEPGLGGQSLILGTLEKISILSNYIQKNSYSLIIEADGGINLENIPLLINKGVSYFVMGNAFFQTSHFKDLLESFQKIQKKHKEVLYENK